MRGLSGAVCEANSKFAFRPFVKPCLRVGSALPTRSLLCRSGGFIRDRDRLQMATGHDQSSCCCKLPVAARWRLRFSTSSRCCAR